ncbi:hypothetical protein DEJ27_08475 [Curtobacterium sp. MCPF17_018]|uniref:hypothetical protein n=1 Tax=Curtobacterium sp. MCPF17_018 TaxID=2175638 RepID=UPI000DAA4783|nr:hypothetical protein [Curtobacterium sp. MCPF17_018]PZE69309.1 hypothetical protein DEJ27_08475 [Curtobacterium sp. MCPF17_018]
MALSDSDHGEMRNQLGALGPALALAASEAKPRAAAELKRMADEADVHWKTIGHGPDLQVANAIRDLLSRVILFKKATGAEWWRAQELAKSMDYWMSNLPL